MTHLFDRVRFMPIVTVAELDDVLPMAEALLEGGLSTIEVNLHTPYALAAIEAIARHLPMMTVGAGMILRGYDVTDARNAGAKFLSSPGLTPDLASAGLASRVPFFPGVQTASEVMQAREMGFVFLRLFPAAAIGGPRLLAAFAETFKGIAFCPVGGLTPDDIAHYLAMPNVPMVAIDALTLAPHGLTKDWVGMTAMIRSIAGRGAVEAALG